MKDRLVSRQIYIITIAVLCLAYAFSVSQVLGQTFSSKLIDAKIHSRALENNLLGDSADQQVAVYLPPSYETSPSKRFPVIYFLHGYSAENQVMERGKQFQDLMNKLIAA